MQSFKANTFEDNMFCDELSKLAQELNKQHFPTGEIKLAKLS